MHGKVKIIIVVVFLFSLVHGCGGGGSSGGSGGGSQGFGGGAPNNAPLANAGVDQTASKQQVVYLDGSASSDADGDSLTYAWTLSAPAGNNASLSSSSSVNPTITPNVSGIYTLSLVVNDGKSNSSVDQMTITVTSNTAPIANAGTDQTITKGVLVNLDGSASSDVDVSDSLSYTWTLTVPPSSSATLSNTTLVNPTFTPDIDGTYIASLVVNDGTVNSSADEMSASSVWMLNTTGETAVIMTHPDNSAIQVNVQSVTISNSNSTDFYTIYSSGIPSYKHTISSAEKTALDGRPKAGIMGGDFRGPSLLTTAVAGNLYDFGSDINFNSKEGGATGCYTAYSGSGFGWFPPGPSCPTDQGFTAYFPKNPTPASSTCYTQINYIGLYKNGAAMFNWSDDQSYNNGGVWHQLAAKFEQYDVDVCFGHATQAGVYHQHFEANCLTEQMGDTGTAHSPIYGYAADGYPIYGQWYANGVKAQSCWKTRDYNDRTASTTGCAGGSAGQRSCVLVDPLDYTKGTSLASGPSTSTVITSSSGNTFTVASGYYFEDYYYDAACTLLGNENLDEHNGHNHGGLGYHYHITDTFPYNVGPTYYGKLYSNSIGGCGSTAASLPPPPAL